MTDAKDVVERLAKAINPLAFEEVGAPQNKGPVMQGYYAVICNKAREQARAALNELTAMGLVVVPEWPTPEMIEVGIEARWQSAVRNPDSIGEIWTAMLTASKVQP